MADVQVVCGCASGIRDHVQALGLDPARIGAVISGLPLLSLPRHLRDAILAGLADVVPEGRRYVQFTYSRRAWRRWHLAGFRREDPRRVWLNVPPASVLPFTRTAA
jgi:phosphatidylethanolamine/phosphatidyl-N-methylethanolamine N-methyltransferase